MTRIRFLAIPLLLALFTGVAQSGSTPSPKQYPEWFIQPKDLGVSSWGNVYEGEFSSAYVFHTTLSAKQLVSMVEAWAHSQKFEVVERTGDTKVVASEFDVEKDPTGAAQRALARGHMRVVGIEAEDDKHTVSLNLGSSPTR